MYRIHRFGRFTPDGMGLHFGVLLWQGSATIPLSPRDDTVPGAYNVPMDDLPDAWHRLHAESVIHGTCAGARHQGGTPHRDHAHLQIGGAVTWDADPHPDVVAHAARTQAMSRLELVRHLGGPHLT